MAKCTSSDAQCSHPPPCMIALMTNIHLLAGSTKGGLLQDASPPEGELASAIDKDFGSLQSLQTRLSGMCAADKLQVRPRPGCFPSTTSSILLCCDQVSPTPTTGMPFSTAMSLQACSAICRNPACLAGQHTCGPNPTLAPCRYCMTCMLLYRALGGAGWATTRMQAGWC